MSSANFPTIAGADWARALPPARERRAGAPARIQAAITKHRIEASGRVVVEPTAVGPAAPQVEGLTLCTAASGLCVVARLHPVDGALESLGVFASPALAAHFLRTFGSPDTCPDQGGSA